MEFEELVKTIQDEFYSGMKLESLLLKQIQHEETIQKADLVKILSKAPEPLLQALIASCDGTSNLSVHNLCRNIASSQGFDSQRML
jgi:hypothetical protein